MYEELIEQTFAEYVKLPIGERVKFAELFLDFDRKRFLSSDWKSKVKELIKLNNLQETLYTFVKDREWNYQVWYILSEDKIILDCDHWSKQLFDDDNHFYVGQLLNGEDYYDKKWCNEAGELIL